MKQPVEMPSHQKPLPIHTKKVEFFIPKGEVEPGTLCFKSMRDYEHMAVNMADILRYIKDAQAYMAQCK